MLLLVLLTCSGGQPGVVQPGVVETVWGNSAGAGAMNSTSIVATPHGSWAGVKGSSNGAVSVEYVGTVTAPQSGPVTFACNVTDGTVVMCQSTANPHRNTSSSDAAGTFIV